MRYVQKVDTPPFFTNDTDGLRQWDEYSGKKINLREYILKEEQSYLCIYCESKISASASSSHLEHIKPKYLDALKLTFDYHNIVVSCNGTCCNSDTDNTKYHCGHRKDRSDTPFVESKFLNPVTTPNIREYFQYDFDDCLISSSDKDIEKSQYMIDTLHLNDGELPQARKKALENFRKKMQKISNIKNRKETMKQVLSNENIAFISFLRFKYSTV